MKIIHRINENNEFDLLYYFVSSYIRGKAEEHTAINECWPSAEGYL
jgi:hypothetical protein